MKTIFVFGSNLRGYHGAGAAKAALDDWGAVMGLGVGPQGLSYAIPTKDHRIQTLPIADIIPYVEQFKEFAEHFPEYSFLVTRIGCGLAGYRDDEMAPLFRGSPTNCTFAYPWHPFLYV